MDAPSRITLDYTDVRVYVNLRGFPNVPTLAFESGDSHKLGRYVCPNGLFFFREALTTFFCVIEISISGHGQK